MLFKEWRKNAERFLQKSNYRSILNNILQREENWLLDEAPARGQLLRVLVEFFLSSPAGVPVFEQPLAIRLLQFKEARTLLNEWRDALKGIQRKHYKEKPLLGVYQDLKNQLPRRKRVNHLESEVFGEDPAFQVFIKVKALVDSITEDTVFKELLREYKKRINEFYKLRCWLQESLIRRNTESGWLEVVPETAAEKKLQDMLKASTSRVRKELANMPVGVNLWQRENLESSLSLQNKANKVLQQIITRWYYLGRKMNEFKKSAAILKRQKQNLLVFLEHVAVPPSNQALETDNGQLKQLWRLSSGCQDKPYTLMYHGHSSSMARNVYQRSDKQSPLEILGFPREIIDKWLYTCPRKTLKAAREKLEKYREPRRFRLRVSRQSLREILKDGRQIWLSWAVNQVQEYLATKGS
jgi:hypothetical protein